MATLVQAAVTWVNPKSHSRASGETGCKLEQQIPVPAVIQ